ncbi:GNAT family N-acetyltransferase [Gorillibacterium sp. sgz5001074]|uniref:GNAT family N-acetyltransferase n=1 Tax=Gorillibacterium sp. sgz5001074 TaxID=3446695 RepID=UPI003F679AC9
MSDAVVIHQATIDDLGDAAVLFDEYRVFYSQEPDLEGARRFLFERFEHGESVIFLARDSKSGEAVGLAQLYPSFSSVSMKRLWILNDLYIHAEHRNRNIGRLLLERAKAFAAATKSKGIEIATQTTNLKAQRVYEAHGYQKDDEFIHYFMLV